MLKLDRFFAVSARDGSMKPDEFLGDGLWSGDTRLLSSFRLLIDGIEPQLVGLQTGESWASFELEARGLRVTRLRFVESGLHDRVTIANPGPTTVGAEVEIGVTADFAAMPLAEFRRAYLNMWPLDGDEGWRLMDQAAWEAAAL